MASGNRRDRIRTVPCDRDHAVVDAFGRHRTTVQPGKISGSAHLPESLSPARPRVRTKGPRRTTEGSVGIELPGDARPASKTGPSPGQTRADEVRRAFTPSVGLGRGRFEMYDVIEAKKPSCSKRHRDLSAPIRCERADLARLSRSHRSRGRSREPSRTWLQ